VAQLPLEPLEDELDEVVVTVEPELVLDVEPEIELVLVPVLELPLDVAAELERWVDDVEPPVLLVEVDEPTVLVPEPPSPAEDLAPQEHPASKEESTARRSQVRDTFAPPAFGGAKPTPLDLGTLAH